MPVPAFHVTHSHVTPVKSEHVTLTLEGDSGLPDDDPMRYRIVIRGHAVSPRKRIYGFTRVGLHHLGAIIDSVFAEDH